MRWLLCLVALASCVTTRERPLAPVLKAPCPETEAGPLTLVPAPPSPRRIAIGIETVGAASGATTPVCQSSVARFRTAVVEAFVAAGFDAVVVPVSATAKDLSMVGASKVLRGKATVTSHEPESFMQGTELFLVEGSYSLSLVDGDEHVLATSTGLLNRRRQGLPLVSFDRATLELIDDNLKDVMGPLLGALAAP